MVMIMGTSNCHMVLGTKEGIVPGMCGFVEDGIMPGLLRLRGRAVVRGRSLRLVRRELRPGRLRARGGRARASTSTSCSKRRPPRCKPGESGLLALDWWNGNRSVLVDVDLTGLLLGATLATKPEEIYRALIEATAYGTRVIIETFEANGVPVNEIVACGGLPERNKLLMQIYADVTGRPSASPRRTRAARWARPCTARWPRARRPAATTSSWTPRPRWRACAPRATSPMPPSTSRLRQALRRVRHPARLLRPRRQRRHEAAEDDARRASWQAK